MKKPACDRPFFCSWSGGKDSCLALYHAMQGGERPQALLTMMVDDGNTSRSHGLPRALLEEQARMLGVPIVFHSASWDEYEDVFISALQDFRRSGIEIGVFGDIDIDSHREWVQQACAPSGITPIHPLWKRSRQELLQEFISLGFKATIVVLKDDKLDKSFLGRTIDNQTIAELEKAGVDASGELGEYHTVVTAGPIFSSEIALEDRDPLHHEGYWFLLTG